MYVTLFSIILVIGLLLLLLPINIYKKWFDNRVCFAAFTLAKFTEIIS